MLPPRVFVPYAKTDQNGDLLVRVAKELLRIRWLERGSAIVLQTRLHNGPRPDLLMAAHMSSAAQLVIIICGSVPSTTDSGTRVHQMRCAWPCPTSLAPEAGIDR